MEVGGQLHAPTALLSETEPPVPVVQEAEWDPAPVWILWRREMSCSCRESNPGRPAGSLSAVLTELSRLLMKITAIILLNGSAYVSTWLRGF
jgi:hypothetical protein